MNSNACGVGNTCVGYRCYMGQPGPGSFRVKRVVLAIGIAAAERCKWQFLTIGGHGRLARTLWTTATQLGGAVVISGGNKIQFHGS